MYKSYIKQSNIYRLLIIKKKLLITTEISVNCPLENNFINDYLTVMHCKLYHIIINICDVSILKFFFFKFYIFHLYILRISGA